MTPDERDELLVRLDEKVGGLHRELLGNGQPGRIKLVEDRVDSLEDTRAKAKGWMAGISAVGAVFWGTIEWFLHRRG